MFSISAVEVTAGVNRIASDFAAQIMKVFTKQNSRGRLSRRGF